MSTVEEKIILNHHCSVEEFLVQQATQGSTPKDIAEILGCGVSNIRRISRKYNIKFNQHHCVGLDGIHTSEEFNRHEINGANILSRMWSNIIERAKECEEEVA
ncbi:MAG: hypothetical protein COB50_00450 [Thiotrichales bacterium]|nr:MAG: hypothetical protein COB50_00450 [Thiotrichales bacterium]